MSYSATDTTGNEAVAVTRTVFVENINPVVSVIGSTPVILEQGKTYESDLAQGVSPVSQTVLSRTTHFRECLDSSNFGLGYHGQLRGDPEFSNETAFAGKSIFIDRDTAAAEVYVETWDDGSDGGADGFGPWNLSANPAGGAAGFFLGDSLFGSGDINTNNQAFGLYGNGDGAAAANADRSFQFTIIGGSSFSIQLALDRTGNKGIDLDNADGVSLWNFNVGPNAVTEIEDYSYAGLANQGAATSLGLDYQSDSVFTLTVTALAGTRVSITLARDTAANGRETPLCR